MTPERIYPENRFTMGIEPFDTYLNTVFEDVNDAHTFIDLLENHPDSFYPSAWHTPSNKDLNRLISHIFNEVCIEAVNNKEHGQGYTHDLWYFVSFTAYLADILKDDDEETAIKNLEEIEYLTDVLIENKELRDRLNAILIHLRDYEQIYRFWKSSRSRECDLYPLWDRVCNTFGYKKVSKHNNPKFRPDGWVAKDGADIPIPVEVKLHSFDQAALKQLQGYMTEYECSEGIAIGEKLTVELPHNIRFISIKELEDADVNKGITEVDTPTP